MHAQEMPLFPLNTVLFPKGKLPLRIFEPRYLDMVKYCLKHSCCFGVVLASNNKNTAAAAQFCDLGTEARIIDFDQLEDGFLGITAQGERKFRVLQARRQEDGLFVGTVEPVADEARLTLGHDQEDMARLLDTLQEHPLIQALDIEIDLASANEVGWRLAEFLPFPLPQKQALLALGDPIGRLNQLREWLAEME